MTQTIEVKKGGGQLLIFAKDGVSYHESAKQVHRIKWQEITSVSFCPSKLTKPWYREKKNQGLGFFDTIARAFTAPPVGISTGVSFELCNTDRCWLLSDFKDEGFFKCLAIFKTALQGPTSASDDCFVFTTVAPDELESIWGYGPTRKYYYSKSAPLLIKILRAHGKVADLKEIETKLHEIENALV